MNANTASFGYAEPLHTRLIDAGAVRPLGRILKELALPAFCVAVGLGFATIARDYAFGSAARMGPGFFPTIVGLLLAVQGVILGFVRSDDAGPASVEGATDGHAVEARPAVLSSVRTIAGIAGSFVVFALLAPRFGVVIATGALVVTAVAARKGARPVETLFLAAALAAIAAVVFVDLLGVALPILPQGLFS